MDRPQDLPAGNHYPSNHLSVLSQEFRFLYPRATISERFLPASVAAVRKALSLKPMYDKAQVSSGVPWWVIACVHHMECDADPMGGIDSGDRWDQVSRHVPAGRGPYASFEEEVADAMDKFHNADGYPGFNPKLANWKDPGQLFWFFNAWNGFIQATSNGAKITPPYASAYIYSGVELNHAPLYEKGKDTSDYNFDPDATSDQVGCMAFMKAFENAFGKVIASY